MRIERGLAKKKLALGIFLDIVGAFDNVTFNSISKSLQERNVPHGIIQWIDQLVRHRTVQVEQSGARVKREVMKGNPQGGILSLCYGTVSLIHFWWNSGSRIYMHKRMLMTWQCSLLDHVGESRSATSVNGLG